LRWSAQYLPEKAATEMTAGYYGLLALVLFCVAMFAVNRCDHLDVETGRRDDLDYGSNRGWYWPWSPLTLICFIGILACLFLAGSA
jgi:hypothetical protein